MPSLPVKIGIVIVGLVLYFFAISALLNLRSISFFTQEINLNKKYYLTQLTTTETES